MEPHEIPEQPLPEMFQITTPLPGPLAVNCTWARGLSWGELGETVICEVATAIVTVAIADRLGAATGMAVIVTVGEAGTDPGALYNPEVEMDPHVEPAQPLPETVHFTDVFVLPVTIAENCCCPPVLT
jgi:hypothetical protein